MYHGIYVLSRVSNILIIIRFFFLSTRWQPCSRKESKLPELLHKKCQEKPKLQQYTMSICLKVENGLIQDARYQVLGCPGAIASAMAVVDLIKGKRIADARTVNDGDVFRILEDIPEQKHHCIHLAVKTLQKALDEYIQQSH